MNQSTKRLRNDVILVFSILALALTAFLVFKACAKEGSRVIITVDGEVYRSLPLNTDAVIDVITGEKGEYKNTVTVKDGRVSVSYANCPDGICEKHREIRYEGESIVCLPHKLAVTVKGSAEEGVDIVVQ